MSTRSPRHASKSTALHLPPRPARSAGAGAFRARPRHAFLRSRFARSLAVSGLAGVALFAAGSASAQTTIWEATLTPGEYTIGGETNTGFIGVGTDLAGTLSDTDFVYDGTTYTIDEISRRHSSGQLDLTFAGCCTVLPDASSTWILESAGTQIAIKDLESSPFFPSIYRVSGAPNWQDGQAVTVRIFSPGVPPSAVRNLTARAGNQQVHVTWDRPETIGDTGVYLLHYEYQRKVGSGPWSEWIESPAQTQHTTGFTLTGLDNGTVYSFRVRLINTQRFAGPDGDTVSATPIATYRLSHTHWGIRRGGEGTPVTLSVGDGPFRGRQTYTLHWNGNPVNQAPLHADNPTTMVLPAGQTQVTVQLRAAADADGADKVYNAEVQYPLVARQSGTEVVRTRQSGLYDGNLSVHDNESEPVVSLEAPELVEEGEPFRLTVRFSHRLDRDADIGVGFSNPSSAKWNLTDPVNVLPSPFVITIPEGDLSSRATIVKPDNSDKDGDTEITFVLSQPARDDPWKLGFSAKTVRINDDETPESDYRRGPWLRISPASGRESGDGSDTSMRFRVNLDDRRTTQTTVSVDYRTVDKTATAGSDYLAASGTLTFAPGEKSKEFDVTIKDDQVEDNGETFEVRLENPTGGGRIHPGKGKTTGTIMNTEASVLSATFPSSRFASASHSGGDDRPQVIVEFSEAVAAIDKSTPSVTVTGGAIASVQAHAEDGLEHAYIFWVTPEGKADVTFTLVPNAACDANGICTAAGTPLTEVPRARTIPGPGDSSGSNLSELSMNDTEASEEDDATIDFVVRLDPASTETVTVDYATSDGTATAGSDYTATSGTLTFQAGDTTQTVSVATTDDSVDEEDETFTLTLSSPANATLGDATATGTIVDNDDALPPLTASFSDMPASHTGEEFTFGLAFSEEVEVGYVMLRDTAFVVTGGEVSQAQRQQQGSNQAWNITVDPDGQGTVTITLPETTDCDAVDAICTGDERPLSHSLSSVVAGPVIIPTVSVSDASAAEGDAVAFTVSLSVASSQQVTVQYATSGGTATSETDFTAQSGTLTFAANETSKTVSVATTDDSVDEEDETFTLTLSSPANATLGSATATGTINDNDDESIPTVSVSDASAAEGDAVAFTVSLSAASSRQVTVEYATSGGTATSGTDFTAQSGTLTFAANETSKTVSVATTDDSVDEEDEAFTLTLSSPANATLGDATATGTINDNDDESIPTVGASDASAAEGDAVAFTVSLSAASSRQVTVEYATSGGTATSGTDFTAESGTLTFAANETSKTVSVATADDSVDEEDETFTLTLSSPANATLGDATGTGTIVDNDDALPPLTASFSDMPASHTGEEFTFGLAFSENVELGYVTLRDTAFVVTGGEVSQAQRQQQGSNQAWNITVDPDGQGTVTITLPETTDCDAVDAICTGDERPLSHSLSSVVAGPVSTPAVSVSDASAAEGDAVAFTVSLSAASSRQVTVDYATSGGTATSGTDFTAESGTLTFAANETSKTVSVATTDDSVDEDDETFTLTLSSPANATLGDATATGTINDNDESLPAVGVSDAGAAEGDAVAFTVSLSAASSRQVTVQYATSGGTATSGTDFTAESGTLTFAANETSKTVSVATTDDSVDEEDETFTLTLSSPANATLGDATATGTINDNDDDDAAPLTASFSGMPSSHSGAEFTFGLAFSENVELSYVTLRDTAFVVTGGEVKTAQRQQQGSNQAWNITVEPASATDTVTITLPETTDCNASDAICTGDGRPLSHSLSATVAPAASASASDAAKGVVADDALDDALALADGVTPEEAARALFGERRLSEAQLTALDRLGNRNGGYDLGDALSWIERCRRGEARCGRSSTDSGPAGAAALLGLAAAGRRRTSKQPKRGDSGRRGRSPVRGMRRRARKAGCALAMLLAATMAWSCTDGSAGPAAPAAAVRGPGFLTVEWTGPAAARDIGVLIELEGPGIETVRAPGLDLYQSAAPGRHQIVVAGSLRSGPLMEFRVPDRGQLPLYRVRVVQVTGEDYALRDPGEYRAVITLN